MILIDDLFEGNGLKRDILYPFLLVPLGYCFAHILFKGKLRLDKNGIAAITDQCDTVAFVPWSDIVLCKLFPENEKIIPNTCVCFRNLTYRIGNGYLVDQKHLGQQNWYNKVIVDWSLRKVVTGRMTAEEFERKCVFAFTVTDREFLRIYAWWSQVNKNIVLN